MYLCQEDAPAAHRPGPPAHVRGSGMHPESARSRFHQEVAQDGRETLDELDVTGAFTPSRSGRHGGCTRAQMPAGGRLGRPHVESNPTTSNAESAHDKTDDVPRRDRRCRARDDPGSCHPDGPGGGCTSPTPIHVGGEPGRRQAALARPDRGQRRILDDTLGGPVGDGDPRSSRMPLYDRITHSLY
jgi:hypothetical protein